MGSPKFPRGKEIGHGHNYDCNCDGRPKCGRHPEPQRILLQIRTPRDTSSLSKSGVTGSTLDNFGSLEFTKFSRNVDGLGTVEVVVDVVVELDVDMVVDGFSHRN